jgi:CubicO group peptidase (beta-lactamase class C family)
VRLRTIYCALVVSLAAASSVPHAQSPAPPPFSAPPFERYLELLRIQADIPGLSAAVLQEGQIVWERGFGYQNLESRIPATPDTPYIVGDVSQPFAAVLLLQCVEQRRFGLDDALRRYGVTLADQDATLRQVLSHSSPAPDGEPFKYDPDRFAQLTGAMEWCARTQPYRKSVSHRLLEFLAMKDSVPGHDLRDRSVVPAELWDPAMLERYQRVLERLAVPYKVDKRGRPTRSDPLPPEGITAAGGLVSTVRDLARFDAAIDDGILLEQDTLRVAWTNAIGRNGTPIPTGLGWFVQTYNGEQVVWHFGMVPNAYSALVIKLPARRATLILLANSDGLSAPYQLAAGDVRRSVFATLFLKLFT